jgi:flagellar hook-associated protein 3 FlgL
MLTAVENLAGGAGIDLLGGLRVANGSAEANIDLSQAVTVQDIINTINNAGVYLRARIREDGQGIDIFNQVSGTSLFVGENGGTTATDLGIRTLSGDTPLDDLNFGLGVVRRAGQTDIRIEAGDGSAFEVDLDGAVTLNDVLDLINQAATDAGVPVTADLASTGNGIRLSNGTSGSGSLTVSGVNGSQAAADLGLAGLVSGGGTELIGADTNPVRTAGILDALIQLEEALATDDSQGISIAAGRIDALKEDVIRTHGVVGARSAAMSAKLEQMRSASVSTQVFLSNVQDLDFAEAVTRMQAAEIQLQASLQTAGRLLNQSLMDFLG